MLAYEVDVDGERVTLAGMPDWAVMHVSVSANRFGSDADEKTDLRLHIGGLSQDIDGIAYHTRWKAPSISVGSEIRIRILNAENPDAPIRRHRSDNEVQESPFTDEEARDIRYEWYLELKAEFEDSSQL